MSAPHQGIDRLIEDAGARGGRLTAQELQRVLDHVAEAGFVPNVTGEVGKRGAGIIWNGQVLKASDRLPADEAHYVRHVLAAQEWPPRTTLLDYVSSITEVVRDNGNGALISRFRGIWHLTVIRRSQSLRGRYGFNWVMVEYRVGLGHWVTAFQPRSLVASIRVPDRQDLQWQRRPR